MATVQKTSGDKGPGQGPEQGFVYLPLIAGWLVPGAGHLMVGKWVRGLLLFVSILGMYFIGLGLQGKIYSPGDIQGILDILNFVGQLGLGILYAVARVFNLGASTVVTTVGDYGSKFLVVGGLLNLISAVDAHSLANGRKKGA